MISVSEIVSYFYCPWYYYTSYIVGRKFYGKDREFGNVIHKIHKEIVDAVNEGKEIEKEVKRIIRKNKIKDKNLKGKIMKMGEIIVNSMKENVKILSEIKVKSKRIGIVGKIDRIEIYENSIIPIEIKSKRKKISELDKIQLSAYALILEDIFRKRVEEGILFCFESFEAFKVKITCEDKIRILNIRDEILELKKHMRLPKVNKKKCENCFFRKICLYE